MSPETAPDAAGANTNIEAETPVERLLRKSRLLVALTDAERGDLALSARTLPPLTASSEPLGSGDGPLLVLEGSATVVRIDDSGNERAVAHLGPGDLWFEESLFAGTAAVAGPAAQPDEDEAAEAGAVLRPDGPLALASLSPAALTERRRADPELDALCKRLADAGVRELLHRVGAIALLQHDAARALILGLEMRGFVAGDTLVQAGDPAVGFTVIGSGRARRDPTKPSGSPRMLGRGDWFAETALVLSVPEPVTVTAISDGWFLRLTPREYERRARAAPQLRRLLSALVAGLASDSHVAVRRIYADTTGAAREAAADEAVFMRETAPKQSLPRRLRRALSRYPVRLQPDAIDCGPACLDMVARYHDRPTTMARLRELTGVSRQGCSFFSLAEAAETLGIRTSPVDAEFEDLRSVVLPAIAHIGSNHFVVVYEATAKDVLIADPATGLQRVRRADFERGWKGFLLLFAPVPDEELAEREAREGVSFEKSARQRERDRPIGLSRFVPYLTPYRTVLIEVMLAAVALQLLGLAMPLVTQSVIDRVLVHTERGLLIGLIVAAIGAAAFVAVIGTLRTLLLYDAVRAADRGLVLDFHRRLFRLPLRFFSSRKVGDLLIRFSDNQNVREFLVSIFLGVVLDVVFGLVYLAVICAYDLGLAAVGLLPIPILTGLTFLVTPTLRRLRREVVQSSSEAQSALVESVSSVQTVKAVKAEVAARRRFEALFDKQLSAELRSLKVGTVTGAAAGLIVAAGHGLLLYYGATLVLDGELSIGALVAVSMLIGQVMGPFVRLVGVWEQFQSTAVALERLGDVFEARPEELTSAELFDLPPIEGHVRLDSVTFRYERDLEPALSELSLEILPGERVVVVGRSGSGKTSLFRLLTRLYEPDTGIISIDGHDLRSVSLRSLRSQIGVVPQRVDIFSGTIRENITLGRELSQRRVIEAARRAGVHEVVARLPYAYETVVGESGMARFSGGELQRIAIARALAADPRLLILDEPTSALDAETEAALVRTLQETFAGLTTIVFAHRLAFAKRADRVVVLDRSRLVEQGTHVDLLARGGLYASLWEEQISS